MFQSTNQPQFLVWGDGAPKNTFVQSAHICRSVPANMHVFSMSWINIVIRPEVIPLKSLIVKATCEAFIDIFSRTGIPHLIAMDNDMNFVSKLTKEFLKWLGFILKFSTSGFT